ncbi:MAG TPA: right-handed parallel beta-helix repeat-containing protein [Acidimicrobiales bacterium]|nr:right-handed parallel beta-helix repeat-containing protein [Acidimicrobiales bacterium]
MARRRSLPRITWRRARPEPASAPAGRPESSPPDGWATVRTASRPTSARPRVRITSETLVAAGVALRSARSRRSAPLLAMSLALGVAGALGAGAGAAGAARATVTLTPPATPVLIPTTAPAEPIVKAEPPGTTFEIQSGVHAQNFSVEPKAGDVFEADPGAVLDGGYGCASCVQLRDAFHAGLHWPTENGVVITGPGLPSLLVIRNYDQNCGAGCDDPEQHGVIDPYCNCGAYAGSATNWTVDYTQVTNSFSRAITARGGMVIENSTVDHNGRLGIGGGDQNTGAITIVNDTIVNNNTRSVCTSPGECGGVKLSATGGAQITRNVISANTGPGVWFDGGSGTAADPDVVANNVIDNNTGAAVRLETASYVTVTGNVMDSDGADHTQAVIDCVSCSSVTVSANTVTNIEAKAGVLVYQDSRAAQYPVNNVTVTANTFAGPATAGVRNGIRQCNTASICNGSVYRANVVFSANTYACGSFDWGGSVGSETTPPSVSLSWAQWRAHGFDTTGSYRC